MSEEERFLERWARRKRDAAKSVATDAVSDERVLDDRRQGEDKAADAGPASALPGVSTVAREPAPPAFDLTTLPSLDSITAETDIRAFLLPGVPAELSRAALRRAWSADPAIREFVGLADYDWDFNTDGAIPGFGPLEMTDELRRRVTDMVGRGLAGDDPEPSERAGAAEQTTADAGEIAGGSVGPAGRLPESEVPASEAGSGKPLPNRSSVHDCDRFEAVRQEYAASQNLREPSEKKTEIVPRRHGRALPT